MYLLGHLGISLLLFSPLAALLFSGGQVVLAVLTGALMIALGSFPDFDEYTDRVPHRGPTHTVWFALGTGVFVALVVFAFSVGIEGGTVGGNAVAAAGDPVGVTALTVADPLGSALWFGAVATLAICGHLAGDILTPMGIWPFQPVSDVHYSFDITPAKNPRANWTLLAAGSVSVALAVAVGHVA